MSTVDRWPVSIAAVSPVSAGAALWRHQGQLSLTVAVKACFALVPNAPMSVAPAEPLLLREQHGSGPAVGSLSGVDELLPPLSQVDVLLYGHAYAPAEADGGPAAYECEARLAIRRADAVVLDKRVIVRGDRAGQDAPAPFERMPLSYERALGGIGHDNPLGVGADDTTGKQPNLLLPSDPAGGIGGFGPLPKAFPARRRLLGGQPPTEADGILDIPTGLDWRYFQYAPADQQIHTLVGDESMALTNLAPGQPDLRSTLPGVRALARIYGYERVGVPDSVPLRADLLQLRPDQSQCAVLWRGSFPVGSVDALKALVIAVGLEQANLPVSWPATVGELPATSYQRPASDPSGPDELAADLGTVVLADPGADAAADAVGPQAALEPAPGGGQVWTAEVNVDQVQAALAGEHEPFDIARPEADQRQSDRPVSIPGAPWSDEQGRPVPPPAADGPTLAPIDVSSLQHLLPQQPPESQDPSGSPEHAAPTGGAEDDAAAAAQAAADAEARRQAEAERFEAEQAEAQRVAEQRAAERREAKRAAAKTRRQHLYGGFGTDKKKS